MPEASILEANVRELLSGKYLECSRSGIDPISLHVTCPSRGGTLIDRSRSLLSSCAGKGARPQPVSVCNHVRDGFEGCRAGGGVVHVCARAWDCFANYSSYAGQLHRHGHAMQDARCVV
jgi:hypothetical protein